MTQLSVLIPSRNEAFLGNTINSILENIRADTEIIVVLDGQWPVEPIPDHGRVTMIYHPVSVGQRAACNEAARVSTAKYIMKLDAHCDVGPGFDRIMLEDIHDNWTMVPIMRNLHVFDWLCQECGHRHYQGPTPEACPDCGGNMERDIVWIAKTNPASTSYCFDPEPHFQYFRQFKKRPEGKGDLTETMSLQGSCWMMTREKYFELGVCDEEFGSWGSQGIEVAVKTWLSGGRVIVNHKTYYAHAFRTQGGDWSFPYPLSGSQVRHAKKMARDVFFNDKWDKQVRPLSWLIDRFKPVPGWHDKSGRVTLAQVTESGAAFTSLSTNSLSISNVPSPIIGTEFLSMDSAIGSSGNAVTGRTVSSPTLAGGNKMALNTEFSTPKMLTSDHILSVRNKSEMVGVTAQLVVTDMVNLKIAGDEANLNSVDKSMDIVIVPIHSDVSVASSSSCASPIPASSAGIYLNASKNPVNLLLGENRVIISDSHSMPPSQVSSWLESEQSSYCSDLSIVPQATQKSILYYTDNRLLPAIMAAVQAQLLQAGLPIVSVSLQPLNNFGRNIVLNAERSSLTLFRQILAGLEAIDTDVVFFAEHDVLYHQSHFNFIPKHDDLFCYNNNLWKVDIKTGRTLFHYSNHTSQLCAKRTLLLEHYRKRVAMVEENGFSRRMGYEPGTNRRKERVDDYWHETWMSAVPNVDIRHSQNLTASRWKREEFRNQKYTKGWTESDSVPGWGTLTDFLPNLT